MVYGTWIDPYACHKHAYNQESFKELLESSGREWESVKFKEVIKHDYPAIGGVATK